MLLIAAALIAAPAPAVATGPAKPLATSPNCPRTTNYHAWQRGKALGPQKLGELPPAIGYMAVYRRVGGCEVPMTVIEYRNRARR